VTEKQIDALHYEAFLDFYKWNPEKSRVERFGYCIYISSDDMMRGTPEQLEEWLVYHRSRNHRRHNVRT